MLELVTDQEDLPTNDRCFARQFRETLLMEYRSIIKAPPNFARALAKQRTDKRIQKAIRDGTREIEEIDKHWKIF